MKKKLIAMAYERSEFGTELMIANGIHENPENSTASASTRPITNTIRFT
jgi:hypothetical protein